MRDWGTQAKTKAWTIAKSPTSVQHFGPGGSVLAIGLFIGMAGELRKETSFLALVVFACWC